MRFGENILIVCTYTELAQMYQRVLKEYNMNIDVEVMDNRYGKDMQKIFDYMTQFRSRGKDLIITRGFLARQLRQHTDFKVIEIHISAVDVLSALYPLAGKDYCVGVVESEPYLKVVQKVAQILGLRTKWYPVEEVEDFEDGLRQAKKDGVDVVVGGAWHSYDQDFFTDYGIPYIIVESSKESIEQSLQNALEVYKFSYEQQRQKELLETMVAFSEDGIFAIDESGKILLMNAYCKELFENDEEAVKHFAKGNKGTTEGNEVFVERIGEEFFLVHRIPLWVQGDSAGIVYTLKREKKIREDENLLRTELSKKGLHAKYTLKDIYGKSKSMTELKKQIARYAATDATILILGESGTGKELFAQAVHNCSLRRNNPFVAINCSALPMNLLESELFGYVDGAFTGAKKGGKAGMFELAHTGTLFLDEIGEMDLSMQSRLLRALQEKEIMRIGDNKVIAVDVRIVAATNRDLYHEVEEGRFREDLYYRLNLLDISIPPLRERTEDIREIAAALLPQINERLHCRITAFSPAVMDRLEEFPWKGNVRELCNTLEKMALLVQYGTVKMEQVSFIFHEMEQRGRHESVLTDQMTLAEMERKMIQKALQACGGNQTKAAARLGIERTTLHRKLTKMM